MLKKKEGKKVQRRPYNWENFTNEDYYKELHDFFSNIFKKNEQGERAQEWETVIFVSRKAYALFLLFEEKRLIDTGNYKVYSDRYIMKSLDSSMFKSQVICLVDDTITTGRHLADIYELIQKKAKPKKIIPYIFMQDTNFEINEQINLLMQFNNIDYHCWLKKSANDILKFCCQEMLIIHQENIPYAIELPLLCEKDDRLYIEVSEKEFQELKKGNEMWKYISCNQSGYMLNDIYNAVMVMRNNRLAKIQHNFIFDLVVRMQITECSEGYHIIVLPFAILKSINYDELDKIFTLLYTDTEYLRCVNEYKELEKKNGCDWKQSIAIAQYRAIVYCFSKYIGINFKKFLTTILDREIVFSNRYQDFNFDSCFLESTDKILSEDFKEFLLKALSLPEVSVIETETKSFSSYLQNFGRLSCDYRTMYLYILALIDDTRRGNIIFADKNIQSEQSRRFVSIEELENLILLSFPESDDETVHYVLTQCIYAMLEQSKISNEVCYDKKNKIVYRGFKYGETSEALLDIAGKIFYAAVSQYYDKSRLDGKYKVNYDKFLQALKRFLSDKQLYGNVLTRDEFEIFSEMFRDKGDSQEIQRNIENRRFIIDDEEIPTYIKSLKQYIQESNIYM